MCEALTSVCVCVCVVLVCVCAREREEEGVCVLEPCLVIPVLPALHVSAFVYLAFADSNRL